MCVFCQDQEVSSSPPVSEFVSDALHLCRVKEDDLRRDVQQQLVLDERERPGAPQGESPCFTFSL